MLTWQEWTRDSQNPPPWNHRPLSRTCSTTALSGHHHLCTGRSCHVHIQHFVRKGQRTYFRALAHGIRNEGFWEYVFVHTKLTKYCCPFCTQNGDYIYWKEYGLHAVLLCKVGRLNDWTGLTSFLRLWDDSKFFPLLPFNWHSIRRLQRRDPS